MTMAAIANVTRYTNVEDYEFILMSNDEKFPVRDDYKVLKIDRYERTNGLSYTKSMNEGASLAKYDTLVFMQNDVFVWDGWLPNLKFYIESKAADCVIPDQCPRDRAFVEKSYSMTFEEGMKFGSRDAGLLMITKEGFEKAGRWNEDLTILAEKDFYDRMAKNGVNQIDTCKVMITHIMAATNLNRLDEKPQEYEAMMKHDAEKLNQ
jgi:hypothetical protein